VHIGVNAHLLSFQATYRSAGISRYIHSLLPSLSQANETRRTPHRFTAFTAEREIPTDFQWCGWDYATTRLPTARPPARILWEQAVAPVDIVRRGIDVLHCPAYVGPIASRVRTVVTIHDLSFYRFPHLFNRFNRVYLGVMTRLSARRATRVIAVSHATARDVVELLGIPAARVAVVHNGVDQRFQPLPESEIAAFRAARGLPDRFILHLGTLEPRKNLTTLIRAFARLKREQRIPHKLVLAGGRGWLYDDLFRQVEQLDLKNDVLFPGYVALSEQPLWYNAAAVFAYPSLYEGFGLPPLEALACGVPVVTSNTSSLPEVVGNAGVLVPPTDDAALANAILSVLEERDDRAASIERALHQASQFSWDRAGKETLDVIDNAYQ
jgi:glycosyltransferase involved in cell wall biosynthesis